MMTPYEKIKSLDKSEQFPKPGITLEQFDAQVAAITDNKLARHLNNAREILFKTIFNRSKTAT